MSIRTIALVAFLLFLPLFLVSNVEAKGWLRYRAAALYTRGCGTTIGAAREEDE
jgi:hypothetical protein